MKFSIIKITSLLAQKVWTLFSVMCYYFLRANTVDRRWTFLWALNLLINNWCRWCALSATTCEDAVRSSEQRCSWAGLPTRAVLWKGAIKVTLIRQTFQTSQDQETLEIVHIGVFKQKVGNWILKKFIWNKTNQIYNQVI